MIPGYAAAKSFATLSALESASEVNQTTLPSLRAASTRASWAGAATAESVRQHAMRLVTRRACVIHSEGTTGAGTSESAGPRTNRA